MAIPRTPTGLAAGGRLLWRALATDAMPEPLVVLLTEACRLRDRLDRMDRLLRGDASCWAEVLVDDYGIPFEVKVSNVLTTANTTATTLANLLVKIPAPVAAVKSGGGSGTSESRPATPLDQLGARREQRGDSKSTRARTAERRRPRK